MAFSSRSLQVSVVIPVYNDAKSLERCLEALTQQTYDPSQYEVIVVDNGSTKIIPIESAVNIHPRATLVQELTPGSYAARNKGISVAKGEVLAFTDADCIPSPTWLEKGVNTLMANPQCGLVGGRITMRLSNPEAPSMIELYESVRALPQREFIEKDHFAVTANLFTTRKIFEEVGRFNSELKSSGDLEWGKRVHAFGYHQEYSPEAVVFHPTRSSFDEFYKRNRRLAGGHYDLQMRQAKSEWQRQISVLKLVTINLIPPVFFTINTLRDPQIKGVGKKLKISLMLMVVRYINLVETLRLRFGQPSIRT
jgi:glycosyltransferase involved in cell wall biosynthesis